MKKTIAILLLIFLVIVICIFYKINQIKVEKEEIAVYNSEFEEYNKNDLNGIDITTIINKAINKNESNSVEKNEDGLYIDNGKDSIKIDITLINNNVTYPMEAINELGMSSFTAYFAEVKFNCKEIKYHESTGKISYMLFESTTY